MDCSLPTKQYCRMYQRMVEIRRFEETLGELFSANKVGGTSHFCIGQEACAVGVVWGLRSSDYLVSNHRGHGHLLARGLDPFRVFAELMGGVDGYCAGRGGSQHMCSMEDHFLGTNGITGGGLPVGVGAAAALKHRGEDALVAIFFGDGAANQGTFHESLNLASLWNLPVLFVCENNGYAMSMPVARTTAGGDVAGRAAGYGMTGRRVDGMDLEAVWRAAGEAAEAVRARARPQLLELTTYRHCGHSKNDPRVYRNGKEEAEWLALDCLVQAAESLRARGVADKEIGELEAAAAERIAAAAERAAESAAGDQSLALEGVYAG